jgi:hypothetical protein
MDDNDNIGADVAPAGGNEATISDTAGDAWDNAFAEDVVDTPEAPAANRDAQGRFAKAAEDPAAPAAPAPEPAPPAEQQPAAPARDTSQAPSSWKPEAKAGWETLPEHVRAEVWRRESDMHEGFRQYRQAADFGGEFARALAPYAENIRASGITPAQAAGELFALEARLRAGGDGARQALEGLARAYGISAPAPQATQYATQQPQYDPTIRALEDRIGQLTQFVQGQQEQARAAQEQEAYDAIDAFRQGPEHPHFDALKAEMGRLLQAGLASDLADAYEQASWRVPAVREAVLAAKADAQRKEEERKVAEAKAAAAVNVKRRGALPPAAPVGKIEDTIGSAWDAAMRG